MADGHSTNMDMGGGISRGEGEVQGDHRGKRGFHSHSQGWSMMAAVPAMIPWGLRLKGGWGNPGIHLQNCLTTATTGVGRWMEEGEG